MGRIKLSIFVIFVLALVQFGSAIDYTHVVTNSENWIDVYSGLHYATLEGVSSDFLTSSNHGSILLDSISKEKSILVLTSRDEPYVFNYPDLIISEGFKGADEIISKNLNLELIDELLDIQNFVIVDDSYGYNAIAVAPYAVQTNSWVFFADRVNIDDVDAILSRRNVKNVLIYGYIDREVVDTLNKYNPTIIYNQDKFEDNIEIVEKYMELNPRKQALLTNGEFIEKEIMGGTQPILFTGRENVPDKIRDYLKTSDIQIGVLIGNELMGAATNIRRSTGISVMVKFARGARVQTEGVSAVEGLDLFPLPSPSLEIEVYAVEYNKLTQQLEVTYKSTSNVPVYLKGTITLLDGNSQVKVGDTEVVFISPGSYKTATYPLEVGSYDDLKANIFAIYGESKSSLDHTLNEDWDVKTIDVIDNCEIEVKDVKYNKQKQEFQIVVKNTAGVDCWVDASIEELQVGYEEKTIATDRAYKIESGKTKDVLISEQMLESDFNKNNFLNVVLHYGEKETSLVKVLKGRFELSIVSLSTVTYVLVVLVMAIFAFFFLFLWRRKKENDDGFNF
ncbi:hypothetical protein GW932_02315 [archaeon]|nr:hypothetical protein [archaeon]